MNENHTFQIGCRNVLSIEVTTVRTVAQNNLCGNLHTRAGAVTAANAIDSVAQRKGNIEFAVVASPHNTPQPQGLVTARRHQLRAIWREPGRPHPVGVPLQRLHALACRDVPHSHGLVKARRH